MYDWFALMIGNSRLHWGKFYGQQLVSTWHTPHYSELSEFPLLSSDIPIYIASVVPEYRLPHQVYSHAHIITLKDIPLPGIYDTMGIDRALAIWGAIKVYGYPCLVVDGGTAITITVVDNQPQLVGGAILPGLQLYWRALSTFTAALPEINTPSVFPPRWGLDTSTAMASGVIHTVIAGIKDFLDNWQQQYPHSHIIFTGGDGDLLREYLYKRYGTVPNIVLDEDLIFWGYQQLMVSG